MSEPTLTGKQTEAPDWNRFNWGYEFPDGLTVGTSTCDGIQYHSHEGPVRAVVHNDTGAVEIRRSGTGSYAVIAVYTRDVVFLKASIPTKESE